MPAITKVSMLVESTFCAIASSTGRPSTSGLTFTKVEFESVEFAAAPVATDRTPTDCSTAEAPAAQGQHRNASGNRLQLRPGTLTLRHYVQNVGTSGDSVTDLPCWWTASTLLVDGGAPPAASSTITTGVSATRITPGTANNWEHGLLVAVSDTGKFCTTRITGTTGGDKILSPALPATPANGSTARHFRQLYAKRTWSTATVAVRLDGIGFRMTALGCAASEITWERMRDGRIMQTDVLQVAHWEEDHGSADPTCDDLDCNTGWVDVNALNVLCPISTDYCGEGGTLVEPAESARTALQVESWKVNVKVATEPKLCPENALGIIGWRRSGRAEWTIDLPMCTTQPSFFASDRAVKARRQLHLDAGPFGQGEGFTIALGGVFLKSDPQVYERGEDEWRQKLVFGAGDYCADSESAPAAAGVDAYVIVGWEL